MDWPLMRYLWQHPLNRRMPLHNVGGIVRWYLGTRLLGKAPLVMPFANGARLIATPGRWGSEANALCGLHEFSDMGFLLHFLRLGDLFVDIGANVGAFTVLASAAIGARSVACEPVGTTFDDLMANVAINRCERLVRTCRVAVGRSPGMLQLTSGLDTTNHVAFSEEITGVESVKVDTLDHLMAGGTPALIKVDVEGWEQEVLAGGATTLKRNELLAVILELNGSGQRYGFNDDDTHQMMVESGFAAYRYAPFERRLTDLEGRYNSGGNTLYLRDAAAVQNRLASAQPFRVRGLAI